MKNVHLRKTEMSISHYLAWRSYLIKNRSISTFSGKNLLCLFVTVSFIINHSKRMTIECHHFTDQASNCEEPVCVLRLPSYCVEHFSTSTSFVNKVGWRFFKCFRKFEVVNVFGDSPPLTTFSPQSSQTALLSSVAEMEKKFQTSLFLVAIFWKHTW